MRTLLRILAFRPILVLLFYGVVLPTGLMLRLLGRDPMPRTLDREAASYRVPSTARQRGHMAHR